MFFGRSCSLAVRKAVKLLRWSKGVSAYHPNTFKDWKQADGCHVGIQRETLLFSLEFSVRKHIDGSSAFWPRLWPGEDDISDDSSRHMFIVWSNNYNSASAALGDTNTLLRWRSKIPFFAPLRATQSLNSDVAPLRWRYEANFVRNSDER